MMQSDSIQLNTEAGEEVVVQKHHQPTPAQILSWLPKSATPSQQDSAIQAHIKPAEIHWSQRPDTLHLPGHPIGKSIFDATIPQYYKESFFSGKEYFHPEITGGRQGVAGDPLPYSIAGDNFMSSVLLLCLVMAVVAISRSGEFVSRQLKSFFYTKKGGLTEISETSSEIRFQLLLIFECCLLLAISFFFYVRENVTETFIVEQYQIILLFSGVFAVYFIGKWTLQNLVNMTFFERKNIQQWNLSYLFLIATEGLFLLPFVFVQSFFAPPVNSSMIYVVLVVLLFKLLAFYKQYQIFFSQKGQNVQIFLYFCALEAIPLSILWGILMITSGYLKINF